MAVRVIIELQAKPGRRAELHRLLKRIVREHGANPKGYIGSTRYEALDNPDVLIEVADWESSEARSAHLQELGAVGALAPLMDILAAPFRATEMRELP